ncbi:hypothetical protein [Yersinia aldovae]|uniref:hypothetical protein n=1 Tax=Yersinia aldovae TaxID=29483 RepID=UPI0005ACB611|nr:hypothetical protein [Yersinia aldovae]AJJ64146.1 putative membrane protein involved in colicin uptake [Yersinia aldovae 670-83]
MISVHVQNMLNKYSAMNNKQEPVKSSNSKIGVFKKNITKISHAPIALKLANSTKPPQADMSASIVNVTAQPARIPTDIVSELSIQLEKRNNGGLDGNKTRNSGNKFAEEINKLKAQDALEAPKRAEAEAKNDARIAELIKAEITLAKEAEINTNARAKQVMVDIKVDNKGVPLPPPLPVSETSKINLKSASQLSPIGQQAVASPNTAISNKFISELALKLEKRNSGVSDERKTSNSGNKFAQEINELKAQDALEAPKRAEAEAKDNARIAKLINAEIALTQPAVNKTSAAKQVMVDIKIDEKGIPVPPPLRPL